MKLLSWYDSRWGYSSRCVDLLRLIVKEGPLSSPVAGRAQNARQPTNSYPPWPKVSIRLNLQGKRVFIRVDYNVPDQERRHPTTRIRAALPTIQLCPRAGRPADSREPPRSSEGTRTMEYTLAPVAVRLKELLRSRGSVRL